MPGSRLTAWIAALAAVLLVVLGFSAATVSAHTDFESSTPADGDVVDAAVAEVSLVFIGEVTPVPDGIVALDPSGEVRVPDSITADGDGVFLLAFDPPLAGGAVGIKWAMQASDGHILEGSFAFTATAPAATSPASTAPAPDVQELAAQETAAQEPATEAPATETPAAQAPAESEPEALPPVTATALPDASSTAPISLDEFLSTGGPRDGEGRQLIGSIMSIAGVALAIGMLSFLAMVMRGSATELSAIVIGVRLLGGMLVVGGLVETWGWTATSAQSWGSAWGSVPGVAMLLRIVAGLALVVGVRTAVGARTALVSSLNPGTARSLSAAVAAVDIDERPATTPSETRRRWSAAGSPIAVAGAALAVVSFWFDGHTVSRGWRPLHAVVNSVHVVAGSVWVGGVVALMAVAWWRWRRGTDLAIGELIVRFSTVAAIALAAVVVNGAVMAVLVLDGLGDLTGTEWGQVLLLKTGAAGCAMALGAYNHFVLRPIVAAGETNAVIGGRLRSVLTAEAIMLVFVVVVTGWLAAAAT